MLSDKLQREVFHFLFLERLLKISDPKLFVLKGGVNFRFFFESPRYSEDMDLDVCGGSVETLKKNGYKILEDASFLRSLNVYGIGKIIINNKEKAKHTETTQRFKVRLLNYAGEEFPTKVEFSRRDQPRAKDLSLEIINPQIALQFKKASFPCLHYNAGAATVQKFKALADRTETQARDVFDLFLLYLRGHIVKKDLHQRISKGDREKALRSMGNLDYQNYQGQVFEYLDSQAKEIYSSEDSWDQMLQVLKGFLND